MQQILQKEFKTRHDWFGESDPLGLLQEIESWLYYQMLPLVWCYRRRQ